MIHQLIVPASQTLEPLCRTYSKPPELASSVTISSTGSCISSDKLNAQGCSKLHRNCSMTNRQTPLVFSNTVSLSHTRGFYTALWSPNYSDRESIRDRMTSIKVWIKSGRYPIFRYHASIPDHRCPGGADGLLSQRTYGVLVFTIEMDTKKLTC